MPDYVSWTLDDGSQVLFESAQADLVAQHGGAPDVESADKALGRLENIAKAAGQMCTSLRTRLAPDEVQLEIGVGLSAEVGWFFARSTADGSVKVTLTWRVAQE